MWSSFQARINLEERELEAYREERYRGSARVHLNCLAFDNGFDHQMDDGRNAIRLEHILEIQGCLRLHRDYHVPVLVDAADLGHRVQFLGGEIEPFPDLHVPVGTCLRAQSHESIIAAARKKLGQLGPGNQWWVVDVYVEDRRDSETSNGNGHGPDARRLHSRLVRSLRERIPIDRQPGDGLIYQKIRYYQGYFGGSPDKPAEDDWWVILQHSPTTRKPQYLSAFFHHGSFPQAFDALLPIPGLWESMHIGDLHTLIALRCDEQILSYLEHIRHTWFVKIFGGDRSLAAHADTTTISNLQSRVPKISNRDLKFLEGLMDKGTLFSSIHESAKRDAIWHRLQMVDVPIPTLGTFFKDIRYLAIARSVMRGLLIVCDPKIKISIDEGVGGQHRTLGNTILQTSRAAVRRGLRELWRFAFQYGHEMTGADRKVPRGRAARIRGIIPRFTHGSDPTDRGALWRHFFWLAVQEGFNIPAYAKPELDPVLRQVPEPQNDSEGNGQDEPVLQRSGRPFADTVDADCFALSKEALGQTWETRQVTAGFIRRSQFRAFFRHLDEDIVMDRPANLPGTPPTATATDVPVGSTGDTAESPGLPRLSCIDNPGPFDLDFESFCNVRPTRFSVQVFIPGHEPKDVSLPNEESTIKQFYEGLKARQFGFFWQQNRGVSADADFYDWHNNNRFSTLEAKLSADSVQEYEPSAGNTSKRRRRELVDMLNEIASWVAEQNDKMRAVLPNISSAWIDEEGL